MDLNQLFGNVYPFPGSGWQQQIMRDYTFQRQAGLAALQNTSPVPVPSPEDSKQYEIKRKNEQNYARWLARILREPLQDVEFR